MKIGILTYHRAHNYGAYLQAYTLCRRLNEEEDLDAEIIDFRMQVESDAYTWKPNIKRLIRNPFSYVFYKKLSDVFESVADSGLVKKSNEYLVSNSINDFMQFVKGKYDVIIAGSDEIWKVDGFRGFPTPYWLIGNLGCRKFSYAASSRSYLNKLPKEKLDMLIDAVSDFEYVSVRDEITKKELENILKEKNISIWCDPVFVGNHDISVIDLYKFPKTGRKLSKHKKNLLIMTEDKYLTKKIKKELGKEYNLISVFHWHIGYINIPDLNPFEWLQLIKSCDMVLTSYFHATCFSLIFEVPFVCFGTELKSSKLEELMKEFNMISRLCVNYSNIDLKSLVQANCVKIRTKKQIEFKKDEFKKYINILKTQ